MNQKSSDLWSREGRSALGQIFSNKVNFRGRQEREAQNFFLRSVRQMILPRRLIRSEKFSAFFQKCHLGSSSRSQFIYWISIQMWMPNVARAAADHAFHFFSEHSSSDWKPSCSHRRAGSFGIWSARHFNYTVRQWFCNKESGTYVRVNWGRRVRIWSQNIYGPRFWQSRIRSVSQESSGTIFFWSEAVSRALKGKMLTEKQIDHPYPPAFRIQAPFFTAVQMWRERV